MKWLCRAERCAMVRRDHGTGKAPVIQTGIQTSHDRQDKMRRENGPRACSARAGLSSIRRVPDDGQDAVVVLDGGVAKVGVELARSELGCCERQAHIVLAAGLAAPDPASTDLDALYDDSEVG
jgi:hypothetical protein